MFRVPLQEVFFVDCFHVCVLDACSVVSSDVFSVDDKHSFTAGVRRHGHRGVINLIVFGKVGVELCGFGYILAFIFLVVMLLSCLRFIRHALLRLRFSHARTMPASGASMLLEVSFLFSIMTAVLLSRI